MFRSLVAHHEKEPYVFANLLPAPGRNERQKCYFLDVKPSFYVVLYPGNARELALLAGCGVEELPDVLQHFNLFKPDLGNHLLDRIDPMEWHASNPWIKMDFRIRLAFSKRGKADLVRRRRVLPEGILSAIPVDGDVTEIVRLPD